MTHMLHMPSPISTDSEYETQSSGGSPDARSKPVQNDRVADRRRRNGESAKRSRQKRKAALGDMEENYVRLQEGNTHLQEENLRLRQLIASLGADASGIAAHIEPIPSIPEELLSTAKKVKREYRVTTTATSFESEATQSTSQQLELTQPLAVATTVLLLTCCQMANIPLNPMGHQQTTSTTPQISTLPTTLRCCSQRASQQDQRRTLLTSSPLAPVNLRKWTLPDLCSTDSPNVASQSTQSALAAFPSSHTSLDSIAGAA
eukprot:TRINITY_DN1005_c0_g1_i2.p1 TRINITY_DN1005_c0_g1~~TRINITY_DN1005_c0_g1_i2.p1  ORF type:complete len:261 (+),score=5.86 TRINITY_DN1005_c0_g1_i2:228-1010(+)